MNKVYVRWYKEVVEGTIVRENDMFGMTLVEIPIQGVKVKTLYSPKHIYKTAQEACGEYPKTFPTPEMFQHPSFANVGATVSKAIDDAKRAYGEVKLYGREHLDKFLKDHWDLERNMLQLEYWQEYDRIFHAYARKRFEMMRPQQPQHLKTMKIETPATPDEALKIIPSTGNAHGDYFYKVYRDDCEKIHKKDQAQVVPRTIGKKVTVTELALF